MVTRTNGVKVSYIAGLGWLLLLFAHHFIPTVIHSIEQQEIKGCGGGNKLLKQPHGTTQEETSASDTEDYTVPSASNTILSRFALSCPQ